MGAGNKIAAAAVLGAVAGAIAGVLLAPKSGEETRAGLKKWATDFKKEVASRSAKARALTQKKYDEIVDMVAKEYKVAKKFQEKELVPLVKEVKSRWVSVSKEAKKRS